jgi:hypothetical protein
MTEMPAPADPGDWRAAFVEGFATVGYDIGLPRSMTRLLAWLVVYDPPHQSAQQIRAGLRLSAGSVSTATAGLTRIGIVERLAFAGDRRTYYRIGPGGFRSLLEARVVVLGDLRRIAQSALDAGGREPDGRLCEMRDFYAWCEGRFTELLSHGRSVADVTPPARP